MENKATAMNTKEEQTILLNETAQALGYANWAEYEAEQLNWADEEWDY